MKDLLKRLFKNGFIQILQLAFLIFAIFIIPLFPVNWVDVLYTILLSAILFTSIFSLKSGWKRTFIFALITFFILWISRMLNLPFLKFISSFMVISFFIVLVVRLIIQIAKSKYVDEGVIAEAISGYLLLGVMFAYVVDVVTYFYPESINFPNVDIVTMADSVYFTFVTISTLGYGDVLPTIPIARSLAILISVSGQVYLTVIIAMLVGKYISGKPPVNSETSKTDK
ncbi:MAG: ion channel [Bacteroidales bacterium]|nr:ion channel [Bacteroidales bacterium]